MLQLDKDSKVGGLVILNIWEELYCRQREVPSVVGPTLSRLVATRRVTSIGCIQRLFII
jgi:hypothetical protein